MNDGGGYKGWQCVECGAKGIKGDMKRHVEAKHLKNTQVACNVCGKVYKNRHCLQIHVSTSHKSFGNVPLSTQ